MGREEDEEKKETGRSSLASKTLDSLPKGPEENSPVSLESY